MFVVLVEDRGLEELFSLVSRVKNATLVYDVVTRPWGWEGNFHLPVPVAAPQTRSGRRIPVQAPLNEPPSTIFSLPTTTSSWHQPRAIPGLWAVRAGFAWFLGPPRTPWTCGTGKCPIQCCQLTEHHLPVPASNRNPSVTSAPSMTSRAPLGRI